MSNLDTIAKLKEQSYNSEIIGLLECRWRCNIDYDEMLSDLSFLDPNLQLFALVIIVYNSEHDFKGIFEIYKKLGLGETANRILRDTYRFEKCAASICRKAGKRVFDRLQYIEIYGDTLKSEYFELKLDYKNGTVKLNCSTKGNLAMNINYLRFNGEMIEVGNIHDGRQSFYIMETENMSLRMATVDDLDKIEDGTYVCVDLPRFIDSGRVFIL